MSFPSDLEIARSVTPRPIMDVAHDLGLHDDEIEPYGHTKAKVTLAAIERVEAERPRGKYVVVTAISPTPLGEGKSTTTVGLAQGLNRIGKKAAVCIRQPSLGPVFGIKGGAAGGGYSQVIPMADFNLHLTGDVHAIGAAHNLGAAFLDNHLHHGNALGIDPFAILWPRVMDISDRAVRRVIVGLGGKENGIPRETEFVITVASEVMAVLALARDIHDLRARLGRMVMATRKDGSAVTAEDLKVAGSMTALLTDAIKPNLLQTLEGGPAFVHCGPFANIAHGNNSIIADRLALATNEIVCTEAGFGADMGAEKFFDIKCRASGLSPDAAVVVATVRALKMHGGVGKIVAGKPLDPALLEENVDAVRIGAANLAKQIENVRIFGVPVVVAINSFPTDTSAEVEAIRQVALAAGARDAVDRHPLRRGRRRRGDPRPGGLGRGLERRGRLQAALPGRRPARSQDRGDRHEDLRGRRLRARAARQEGAEAVRGPRDGPSPGLHGEDAVLAQPRCQSQGGAERLHRPDPRHPAVGRGGLHHAARRRDADDARPAVEAGRREHRHRPGRERRRAVLGPSIRPAGRRPPGDQDGSSEQDDGTEEQGTQDDDRRLIPGDLGRAGKRGRHRCLSRWQQRLGRRRHRLLGWDRCLAEQGHRLREDRLAFGRVEPPARRAQSRPEDAFVRSPGDPQPGRFRRRRTRAAGRRCRRSSSSRARPRVPRQHRRTTDRSRPGRHAPGADRRSR